MFFAAWIRVPPYKAENGAVLSCSGKNAQNQAIWHSYKGPSICHVKVSVECFVSEIAPQRGGEKREGVQMSK